MLGICLGFQMILYAEGASIVKQSRVLHGVRSKLKFNKESVVYNNIKEPLYVGRYHSLCVNVDSIPESFTVSSWDENTGVPLSVEHRTLNIYGFQYHPDSFLTNHGEHIISNLFSQLGRQSQPG